MGQFKTRRTDYARHPDGCHVRLHRETYCRFDHRILGLGDVTKPARSLEAVCAVFDLAGFTNFSRQVDPHLALPKFMTRFLTWLFEAVRTSAAMTAVLPDNVSIPLWVPLPFFSKFMGDGVMFLWDLKGMDVDTYATNVAALCHSVSVLYRSSFYEDITHEVSYVPETLRVGIARGRVFSVGDGDDFVGPCINIAARLQKIGSNIQWCVAARGFDRGSLLHNDSNQRNIMAMNVPVRGVGDAELVYLLKDEFERLPEAERSLFCEPGASAVRKRAHGAVASKKL